MMINMLIILTLIVSFVIIFFVYCAIVLSSRLNSFDKK